MCHHPMLHGNVSDGKKVNSLPKDYVRKMNGSANWVSERGREKEGEVAFVCANRTK